MTEPRNGVAVETHDLTRRFGSFTAVDRLNVRVEAGQIYGFLGPNGAGKSTTIRMLCGIIAPTSGAGSVGGFDIVRESNRIKENIGYMSQRFSLYADLTVRQNIDFYAGIYKIPRAKRAARMRYVIDMAGLAGRENALTGELSGGWKQRLALGCAILHEPRILFLDEPTAGVDPISRRQFWDLIHEMKDAGVTVFVTTHYMDEAEHCDTLSLIAAGRLVATASPRELKTRTITGALIAVTASPTGNALDALRAAPDLRAAQVFGRSIHVQGASEESAVRAARDALGAAGCAVDAIEPIRPSLEDVFIALVEAQSRTESDRFEGGGA